MRKKILVVDDEAVLRDSLQDFLTVNGYNVVTAADGDEGLRKVLEEGPDLIILDVIMPGKHGFEVCKELKTDPRYHSFSRIPVLMLTVYPAGRDKIGLSMKEGMLMEADDYIQKPFDIRELLERIKRLIESPQT
jgi:DNA-binding response OmpR family regulator